MLRRFNQTVLMRNTQQFASFYRALSTNPIDTAKVDSKSKQAQVFSYGDGFLGCLGTGSYADIKQPTAFKELDSCRLHQVSAGWAHGGVVTSDGKVFLYGRTHGFRNILRMTNMNRMFPSVVSFVNRVSNGSNVEYMVPKELCLASSEDKAVKVACSAALTAILTTSGKISCIGSNTYGQCGVGREDIHVWQSEYVKGLEDEHMVDVAAGFQHVVALSKSGQVYCWGKGENGQLGFGIENVLAPRHVLALKDESIVEVGAGFNHSVALSDNGQFYIWGKKLALNGKDDQVIPRRVKTRSPVVSMTTSAFHTMLLTKDGKIWVVGRTKHTHEVVGDRLVPKVARMVPEPEEVKLGKELKVKRFGKAIDSTIIITDDHRAYTWDWDKGLNIITETKALQVEQLEKGLVHTVVLANKP